MSAKADFDATFKVLRGVLKKHAKVLSVVTDTPGHYSLNAGYSDRWKKVIFFGGAQVGKAYVSFHLMPVYMFPDLLDGLSTGLRARMQGKSCFNFTSIEPALLKELAALTKRCVDRFRKDGLA